MKDTSLDAVIFDLDGTLVDSLADLANATNYALERGGYPTHPLEPYKYFVGNGVETLLRRALPKGENPANFAELLESMRVRYAQTWNVCTRPYPGIVAMLEALQGKNFPMAVLSNKPHDWTQEYVAHFFPAIRFTQVRGAMTGVPHKPDPQSALQTLAALGLPAERTAFVGDSSVDMQTAANSGTFAIGVTWGFRTEAELLESGAKQLVRKPKELLTLL